jgi:peptide/nickel transport system ATP-binding protein
MYAGRVIEQGTTEQVISNPQHPYTQGLIACLPELGSSQLGERAELKEISGVVPSIWELGTGCAFRERCPHAHARCAQVPPLFAAVDGGRHGAACWLLEEASRPAEALAA